MGMADQALQAVELTVDELARRARLPVRTIREYQTLRLLPAPRRQGRIGVYGQAHLDRLAAIGRLQRRGYSLAAIKDLFDAGDAGGDRRRGAAARWTGARSGGRSAGRGSVVQLSVVDRDRRWVLFT